MRLVVGNLFVLFRSKDNISCGREGVMQIMKIQIHYDDARSIVAISSGLPQ